MESLPNELLGMIANDITTESLKALHQVSRRVSAGASGRYYTPFYAVRTHAFSRTGLKVLAEIVSWPGLLSRITTIHIMPITADWYHCVCRSQGGVTPDEFFDDQNSRFHSVNALRLIISRVALHGSKAMITLRDAPHDLIDGTPE
jgi:hypothetical protein